MPSKSGNLFIQDDCQQKFQKIRKSAQKWGCKVGRWKGGARINWGSGWWLTSWKGRIPPSAGYLIYSRWQPTNSSRKSAQTWVADVMGSVILWGNSPLHSHFFVIWKIVRKPTVTSFHLTTRNLNILLCTLRDCWFFIPLYVCNIVCFFMIISTTKSFLICLFH